MRKIREVLRLRLQCGLSQRETATSCKIGLGTVYEYVRPLCANMGETLSVPSNSTEGGKGSIA
jgi:hypothetical protein